MEADAYAGGTGGHRDLRRIANSDQRAIRDGAICRSGPRLYGYVATTSTAQNVASFENVKASFDATAEQRAALFPDQLLGINIDVVGAVRAASETFPRIKLMREEMLKLPNFEVAEIDRIPSYAACAGPSRSDKTGHRDHPIRAIAITQNGASRSPIPAHRDHLSRG